MYNFLATFVNTNGVAFPNTAAVNSSGGGATDGTEFVKFMVDDIWGFFQDLLNYTDDTPNGSSEIGASQLLDSIIKIASNITELSTNTTHTVEEWNKFSTLILSSGCTVARLVGGTGADETNKLLVQNNNTVTVEVDFGAAVNQEEIIMQPGQWIEFVYDSEATKFVFQRSNMQIIIAIAANYTIADWVPSGSKILVSPNSGAQKGIITVTLSTLADNIGKWYEVEHKTGQGLIAVVPETPASEKLNFKGGQIQSSYIYSKGMSYKFGNNGTDWIMKGENSMNIGWQNRSDWTNVHLGNGVTYDNGSAASTKNTDWTGMVITEATSGYTAVVVEDTGGTGTTGILYVYELSSSFTFWTNNRVLTASNGQTIDINETTSSSKNVDYNLYHGFGVNDFLENKWINSNANFTSAIKFFDIAYTTGTDYGLQPYIIDTNSLKYQTGAAGWEYLDDSGNDVPVDSEDWYNYLSLNFSC